MTNPAPAATRRRQVRTTVLVVDDDAEVLAVTTDMLKQLGYRVTGATSGQEALERLSEMGARPELAVLDYAMPGMNGMTLAGALRKRGFNGPDCARDRLRGAVGSRPIRIFAKSRQCSTSHTRSASWRSCCLTSMTTNRGGSPSRRWKSPVTTCRMPGVLIRRRLIGSIVGRSMRSGARRCEECVECCARQIGSIGTLLHPVRSSCAGP